MSERDQYDALINALGDVDILQVEAVGAVIGRTVAKVHGGMLDGGMTSREASRVISDAMRVLIQEIMSMPQRQE